MGSVELWAGFECTVNRVGDRFIDQLELTGHAHRTSDLHLLDAIGAAAVRYPILWERTAHSEGVYDWRWADERLELLRELEIEPIVGLLHHGSGPTFTSLIDPRFPLRFARYARAVAERYPWVAAYTPINEPLTTARFSALYGHWYPHAADGKTFARAVINQCQAIILAVQEIRAVNPEARFIQTEDLGKTLSVPALQYQADFENERRWLTFDLLCGRLMPGRRMWDHLLYEQVPEKELWEFVEKPCPPDIIGLNHYITSVRFLDNRLALYPQHVHGGNGRERYADVEAVRVLRREVPGHLQFLQEAWARYRRPLAVTEVQLACSTDERMRWLFEAWSGALRAAAEGIDVRALTAWSLIGAVGWEGLVCSESGTYEPSVFDLVDGVPMETELVPMLRSLSGRARYHHPHLDGRGWWRRPERVIYSTSPAEESSEA